MDHRGERKLPPKVQRLLRTPPEFARGEASASAANVGAAAAAAAAAGVASVEKSGKYAATKLHSGSQHDADETRKRMPRAMHFSIWDGTPVAPVRMTEELPIVRQSGAYERRNGGAEEGMESDGERLSGLKRV
jgi:hypothetical protein